MVGDPVPGASPGTHPEIDQTYAARTNQGFLLREAGLIANLLLSGATQAEIERQVKEDDIFQLRAAKSRQTILRAVKERLSGAPKTLLAFLSGGNQDVRRLTNFYLILLHHRLLREFIAEVVLAEMSRLATVVSPVEINGFFEQKRMQVPGVGSWSEQTVQKSRSNMLNVCSAAGILHRVDRRTYEIRPQLVPAELRTELMAAGRESFLPLLLEGGSV